MKYISIIFILFFTSYIYGSTITISGSVKDMNNVPIINHLVIIEVSDTLGVFTDIDSLHTNQLGDYVSTITSINITPGSSIEIKTQDCNGLNHYLNSYYPGGSNYDFQICSNSTPIICNSQFTYYEDSISSGTFHFVNQSTNNAFNVWKVNGNIVSQQINFTYTFNTSPSTNNVCLEIADSSQTCFDTECSSVIVNNCNTSFNYSITGMGVLFNVSSTSSADLYTWDFGDGNIQTTANSVIQHTYTNPSNYNVILTAYVIYGQDTCTASDSELVTIATPIPLGKIFGYVFTGNNYLDDGNVVLYTKNLSTGKLIQIDTVGLQIDSNSSSRFYEFIDLNYGEYYIKCIIPTTSSAYDEYIDTWASQDANTQIVFWQNAEAQNLNGQQMVANINLKKAEIIFNGGSSIISGNIINTAGVNSTTQLLFLLNNNRKIVKAIHPQINGDFEFDSLILGTYYLSPELTNYYSLDLQVDLTTEFPIVDSIVISIDSNHFYTSLKDVSNKIDFNVYPNPVVNKLNIEIPADYSFDNKIKIDIYNSLGVHICSNYHNIYPNSIINIAFDDKKTGLYIVVLSGSYGVIVKKIIK